MWILIVFWVLSAEFNTFYNIFFTRLNPCFSSKSAEKMWKAASSVWVCSSVTRCLLPHSVWRFHSRPVLYDGSCLCFIIFFFYFLNKNHLSFQIPICLKEGHRGVCVCVCLSSECIDCLNVWGECFLHEAALRSVFVLSAVCWRL